VLINCDCGTYRPYKNEAGEHNKPAMHLDACVNCGYIPGLGDKLATAIAKVGITPKTPDCGCAKRQQQLNEFGKKIFK